MTISLATLPSRADAQEDGEQIRSEARRHFQQGIELAEAGSYQRALDEFLAAHRLTGNAAVLYNVAQSYVGLGDPVSAVGVLEQYLQEGAGHLAPDRVKQVESQLTALRAEIGEVRILSSAEGGEVAIDDRSIGSLPLGQPVWLTPGYHDVELRVADGSVLRRRFLLGAAELLELTLEPPLPLVRDPVGPGTLALRCPEPVEVWVDGALLVGPAMDPSVALEAGKRRVVLLMKGRPAEELVVLVEAGVIQFMRCGERVASVAPPAPDVPHPKMRTWGYVVGGVGVGLVAFSLGHFFWNLARYERWYSENQSLEGQVGSEDYIERQTKNNELAQSIERASQVTVGLAVGGGALVASGVTLVVLSGRSRSTPNPEPNGLLLSYSSVW